MTPGLFLVGCLFLISDIFRPLGPSTCQSVTMRFLAMLPGVHTINDLILTDLDMGESISLRCAIAVAQSKITVLTTFS